MIVRLQPADIELVIEALYSHSVWITSKTRTPEEDARAVECRKLADSLKKSLLNRKPGTIKHDEASAASKREKNEQYIKKLKQKYGDNFIPRSGI
jgi:hypothetical protein